MQEGSNLKVQEKDNLAIRQVENYNSFDLAKFICSILVVMIHAPLFGNAEGSSVFYYVNFLLNQGIARVAVPLFFIISGFFVYKKTDLENCSIKTNIKYIKRYMQIYVIWSLIYFPLSLRVMRANAGGILLGAVEYIKDFFLVASYGQLWYLLALFVSVLLVSFLLGRNWQPKKIFYLSLAFYVFGILGSGYFGVISPLLDTQFFGEIIKVYFDIFKNTRNALFFGFFFVSVGMLLSKSKIKMSTGKSLVLFLISLFMMCVESLLLEKLDIAKTHELLLFTAPTAVFCFIFLKDLNLKNNRIYKKLRVMSSLIYYCNLWGIAIVSQILSLIDEKLKNTPIWFVSALTLTIVIAMIIIKLSDKKYFRWLKKLY